MTLQTNRGQSVPGAGTDAGMDRRPGVPMETTPRALQGAHWDVPDRQPPNPDVLKRTALDELTPVFGTAQPPRGMSGLLRRLAYRIPEHRASHWALLLFADRVDVLEHDPVPAAMVAGVAMLAIGARIAARRRARRRWFR